MKFFLDENLPLSTVDIFRKMGFEVEHVGMVGLKGANDKDIAAYAKKSEAILITKDVEFGNILFYPSGSHYGLVILRLPYTFTTDKINVSLGNFLKEIDRNLLVNSIIVLELGRFRRRVLE